MSRLRNILLVSVFSVTIGLAVILGTGLGVSLLLYSVERFTGMQVSVADTSGTLARDLTLESLRVTAPGFTLEAGEVYLDTSLLALIYGRLQIDALHISNLDFTQTAGAETTAAETGDTFTVPSLPVEIDLQNLRLNQVSVTTAGGEQHRLDRLEMATTVNDSSLTFRDLNLYMQRLALSGAGSIQYQPELETDLTLRWTLERGDGLPVISASTSISGNPNRLQVNSAFRDPVTGSLDVTLTGILNEPEWQAVLVTRPFNPRGLNESLPSLRIAPDFKLSGTLQSAMLDGSLRLSDIDLPGLQLRAADGGDPLRLGLAAQASRNGDNIQVTTRLDWQALALLLEQRDILISLPDGGLAADYRDGHVSLNTESPVSVNGQQGHLRLTASGNPEAIDVEILDLALSGGEIQSRGHLDLSAGEPVFRLQSSWRDLSLPLDAERELSITRGDLQASGQLNDYSLEAKARGRVTELPPFGFNLTAAGGRDQLQLRSLELDWLDGSTRANGVIRWGEGIVADLKLQGDGLDPASLWGDWPGRLGLAGGLRYTGTGEDYRLEFDDLQATGRLRGQPLSVQVDSVLTPGTLTLNRGRASSGTASLNASGKIAADGSDLRWLLEAPDLTDIHPRASGSIQGNGSIAGTMEQPVLAAQLAGSNIDTPWLSLEALDSQIDLDLQQGDRIDIQAAISGLSREELAIHDLQLRMVGTRSQHRYSLKAASDVANIDLQGRGTYGADQWQGLTRALSLDIPNFGNWTLQDAARTTVAGQGTRTEPLCLVQTAAVVCLQGAFEDSENWNAGVDMQTIPLGLASPWFPDYLVVRGGINLDLDLARRQGTTSGKGNLSLEPTILDFRIDEEEVESFRLDSGEVNLALSEAGLTGGLELRFAELATPILARISLSGFTRPLSTDLSGVTLESRLSGHLDNLGFLSSMNPLITDVTGAIQVDLRADGRLAEPQISGEFNLTGAGFYVPDLGTNLHDLAVHGSSTEAGVYEFTGQWQAGEGIMHITARMEENPTGAPTLMARLNGKQAEIINLPELWALASPELTVDVSPTAQRLSGNILITQGVIDLDEFSSGPTVSGDVVMVDSETGEAESKPASELLADLDIRFGDDIRISGKGIDGRLEGNLDLDTDQRGELIATGEIQIVDGHFTAYGQELDIEEGRLLYYRSNLNNPEIRVRAVRQVQDVTAGVQVSGYLSNPVITLFSTPSMNQEQVLSYIVTGRPLESLSSGEGTDLISAATTMGLKNSKFITQSLGNTFGLDEFRVEAEPGAATEDASLVIGKYLTPSLYVSYGLGLFDSINTARIRYEISDKWSVDVEQGDEVGADLMFTLEK